MDEIADFFFYFAISSGQVISQALYLWHFIIMLVKQNLFHTELVLENLNVVSGCSRQTDNVMLARDHG